MHAHEWLWVQRRGDAFWVFTKLCTGGLVLSLQTSPTFHHYMDDLCPNLRPCHNKTHACCFALHSVARAESKSVKSAYPQVHVMAIETFEAQCRSVCSVRKCVFSCQCQRLKADD